MSITPVVPKVGSISPTAQGVIRVLGPLHSVKPARPRAESKPRGPSAGRDPKSGRLRGCGELLASPATHSPAACPLPLQGC